MRKHVNNAARMRAMRARRDTGTPELVLQRVAAVLGGDPALSTTPLDRMQARGLVSQRQALAGHIYLVLHRRIYGTCFPAAAGYEPTIVGSAATIVDDLEREQQREKAFSNADLALRAVGRGPRRLVRDLVLSEAGRIRLTELGDIRDGLNALARHWHLT